MNENRKNYPRGIARLLSDQDIEGLTSALRQTGAADVRASAAEALAEVGDTAATEFLVRSTLEDPEPSVRAAARMALEQLVGGQAEMAIAVHRAAGKENEPWLQESNASTPADDEHNPAYSQRVLRLLTDNDTVGLTHLLRNPDFPALRAQSALALAELGAKEATELLVRATREDPDADVQAAAQQALNQMFGSQAETVLTSYPGDPSESEPWLIETVDQEDFLDEVEERVAEEITPTELEGFTRIALYEGSEKLRFQAIRILSRSSDMRATDTLANLALWGDNRRLRAAARQALEDRYSDQAEEILDSYRSAAIQEANSSASPERLEEDLFPRDEDDEDFDEFDEDEDLDITAEDLEDEVEDESDKPVSRLRSPYTTSVSGLSNSPIVEETGGSWWMILLAVIGLVVLAAVLILGKF
jgi:HEAT repeat protein